MERGSAACSQLLSRDSGLLSVLQKLIDGTDIILSLKLSDVRLDHHALRDTERHPLFDVVWGVPHRRGLSCVHGAADGSCFHSDR